MTFLSTPFRFCFLLLCWGGHFVWAQQEASFNQYMFLHQTVNAGYAGAKNYSSFTVINRAQWFGFEGGPNSQSFSFNSTRSPKNIGFAVSGLYDRIGPLSHTQAGLDFSYQLKLNEKEHYLGIGLKLSTVFFSLDEAMLSPLNQADPVLYSLSGANRLEPNIGFGLYFQTPRFYTGFSIPRMIEDPEIFMQRHAYLIVGGLLRLSPSLELKPSVLLKNTKGVPLGYDMSVLFYMNERIWVGPQLKNANNLSSPFSTSGVGLSLLAGLHLGQHLSLGYAYGNAIGFSNAENVSSHEIFLRYDLSPKVLGILRSPRLF